MNVVQTPSIQGLDANIASVSNAMFEEGGTYKINILFPMSWDESKISLSRADCHRSINSGREKSTGSKCCQDQTPRQLPGGMYEPSIDLCINPRGQNSNLSIKKIILTELFRFSETIFI